MRTDRPAMILAVDLGRKATKQTNKQILGLNGINRFHYIHFYIITTEDITLFSHFFK